MKELDVRDLSCPEPLLNLKPLIDEGCVEIKVLCSCGASSENVKRMANYHNYDVSILESNKEEFVFLLKKRA